jgi:ATP-dependent DNA helicase RecG
LPTRELLSEMERRGYLERGGTGRGLYYRLTSALANQLGDDSSMRLLRMDWEAAKTRVLSVLHQRAKRGEAGLTNTEIRAITYLDREQVKRLMRELAGETLVQVSGRGRNAVWRAVRER